MMIGTGWIERELFLEDVEGDSGLCRALTGYFRSSVLNEAIALVCYEGGCSDEVKNRRAEVLKQVPFDEIWTEDFEKLIAIEFLGRLLPDLFSGKARLNLNTVRYSLWKDATSCIRQRLREILRHKNGA